MIPSQDFHEQKRIYTYLGKGDWRIVGYCDQPSITMENILNHSRQTFGTGGATMEAFEPVAGLEWDHEHQQVLENSPPPRTTRSPWIAIKDRKPTKEDGNEWGQVFYRYDHRFDSHPIGLGQWSWTVEATHWMPIPPLPKEKEVDPPSKSIQAFEQAWSKYSTIGPLQIMRGDTPLTTKENARKIWNAAILHVAERFMSKSDTVLPNPD